MVNILVTWTVAMTHAVGTYMYIQCIPVSFDSAKISQSESSTIGTLPSLPDATWERERERGRERERERESEKERESKRKKERERKRERERERKRKKRECERE